MKTLEVLQAMDKLLSKPNKFTQGAFARNATGMHVPPLSDTATCWCIMGALRKVTNDPMADRKNSRKHLYYKVYNDTFKILSSLCRPGVTSVNDTSDFEDIKKLLKKAIKAAQK